MSLAGAALAGSALSKFLTSTGRVTGNSHLISRRLPSLLDKLLADWCLHLEARRADGTITSGPLRRKQAHRSC
jgi:hypothetical protein